MAKSGNSPAFYQIRLEGHLDDRWTAWFGSMILTQTAGGETLLTGQLADQAALYGLLKKVGDLGLPLVAVIRLEPGEPRP